MPMPSPTCSPSPAPPSRAEHRAPWSKATRPPFSARSRRPPSTATPATRPRTWPSAPEPRASRHRREAGRTKDRPTAPPPAGLIATSPPPPNRLGDDLQAAATILSVAWDPELLASLEAALTHDPDQVPLRLHVAQLYAEGGRWSEALEHVEAVLARQPANAEALRVAAPA